MNISITTKGQSLIEILFAIAVFTIGVVAIGYLIFDSFLSLRYGIESTQARLLAYEGIEVLGSLIEESFDKAPGGNYGLVLVNNQWKLSSSSDTQGIFSRSVTITDIDTSTKEVTVGVVWDAPQGNQKNVTQTSRFTNWRQNNLNQENFSIDINNAALTASGTRLTGVALRNLGDELITVTHMSVQYSTQTELTAMSIRGEVIFNASSSQGAASGELIYITDYDVPAASGFHLFDYIQFEGDVSSSNFVLSFVLADGSIKHVYISL